MELKYIIVKESDGTECAIMFDKLLTHRAVAACHSAMHGPRVVAAGFCSLARPVVVYGKSESLNGLASREQDAAIIERAIQDACG